jgi:outer membrane receptor for ferrienterochelin and colicins
MNRNRSKRGKTLPFFSLGRPAYLLCQFLIAATFAPLVHADEAPVPSGIGDLSLEQLMEVNVPHVYGASKYEQKVTQAPASVTLLDDADLRNFGYRTLADALRSVRGTSVASDRNYAYVGMRGFLRPGDYNTRVLVLLDGHRVNENVYDSVSYENSCMIDLDLVDRIEVIRGPSSSIYGNNAFFGVINIVTKPGHAIGGSEVSVEAGSWDAAKVRYTYGGVLGKSVDLLVSASYYQSQGRHALYYPEFDERISSNPRASNQGVAID